MLAGCVASLVIATVNDRILFSDGAWWFFNIVREKSFAFDINFARYADRLFQVPALVALYAGFGDNVVLKLYSLFYNFNPLCSILVSAWILKKRDRLDLLIFPVLSFATVTQTTLGDPSVMVSSLLSFTWPLFFLAVLPKRGFFSWAGIVGLVACFAFEHESGVIFLFMLIFVKAFEGYTDIAGKKREHFLLGGLFFTAATWLVYRVVGPTAGPRQFFIDALFFRWDSFRMASIAILMSAILVFFKPQRISSKKWLSGLTLFAFSAAVYTAVTMNTEPEEFVFWSVNYARSTATFFAAIIGLCCFVVMKMNRQTHLKKYENRAALVITCFALAVSLVHDIKLNSFWLKSTSFIKSKISAEPGCEQLSVTDSLEINKHGFYNFYLPIVSIVMSKIEYGNVGTVLYSTESLRRLKMKNVKNFCCLLGQGKLYFSAEGYHDPYKIAHYDLIPVVAAAKAKSAYYGCEENSE